MPWIFKHSAPSAPRQVMAAEAVRVAHCRCAGTQINKWPTFCDEYVESCLLHSDPSSAASDHSIQAWWRQAKVEMQKDGPTRFGPACSCLQRGGRLGRELGARDAAPRGATSLA